MRVGHEGAGLTEVANTALEGTTIATVGPGTRDHHTGLATRDITTDESALCGGPCAGKVDVQADAEALLEGAEVDSSRNGHGVGDGEGLGDGNIDTTGTGTDNDWGHLHVPIHEALSLVDDVLVIRVAVGALVEAGSGVVQRELEQLIAALEPVVVDLGSISLNVDGLEEEVPSFLGDNRGCSGDFESAKYLQNFKDSRNDLLRPSKPKTSISPLRRSRSADSVMLSAARTSSSLTTGAALTAAANAARTAKNFVEIMLKKERGLSERSES